jgi:hypothetical protein
MTVRQDFSSFIIESTLASAALGREFLVDLFDTIIECLNTGRARLLEGAELSGLLACRKMLLDDHILSVKTCRFDKSLWEPRLAIAFSSKNTNCILSLIRSGNTYSFSVYTNDQKYSATATREDGAADRTADNLCQKVFDFFALNNWSISTFADYGRETVYAPLNNRLHDGLFSFSCARLVLDLVPDANFAQLCNGSLLNLSEISTVEPDSIIRVDRYNIDRLRDSVETSWIEAFSFDAASVYTEMESLVSQIAARTPVDVTRDDHTLVLYMSYEAEKRAWIEQDDGFHAIFSKLSTMFEKIEVLLNGMTGSIGGESENFFPEIRSIELAFTQSIEHKFPKIKFRHLFGMSLAEKIGEVSRADYYIGPIVSAVLVPQFLRKSGFAYGNSRMLRQFGRFLTGFPETRTIALSSVRDTEEDHALVDYNWAKGAPDGTSYHIDPDLITLEIMTHLTSCLQGKSNRFSLLGTS